jgi:hypothetical protein
MDPSLHLLIVWWKGSMDDTLQDTVPHSYKRWVLPCVTSFGKLMENKGTLGVEALIIY